MSSIREAQQVWQAILRAHQRGADTALLSLVAVRGSAYRRPGAKMMMASDGEMFGTLSGGCLEGDLYHYAEEAMQSGKAQMRQYDLTEDTMWGLGIGCKGTITVWVEPLKPGTPFWQLYGQLLTADQPFLLWAQLPEGFRRICHTRQCVPEGVLPERIVPWRGATEYVDGVLYDVLVPPQRLVVAGAGHDAGPLVALADQAGFEVTVLDPRPHFNNARKLPGASEYLVKQAEEVAPQSLRGAYWVIMNHHEARDRAALALALSQDPQYIGMLGPRSRTLDLLNGHSVPSPMRTPVGLNIGAETVDEVAISIVAELLAARNGKTGGPLNGQDRIHD